MTFDRNLIIFSSVAMLGLVACEKKESSETQTTGATRTSPETTTTSVQPTTSNTTPPSNVGPTLGTGMEKDVNDAAIERLTEARCKREVACNNIGNGKKWNDEAACKREVRQNIHSDYRQSECHNVLQDKLQSCIDAINGEKCDSAFDLARMNACRKGNICKD